MNEMIIPLRPKASSSSPLARFDLLAAELLATGQATSLQAARVEAILADLREQRGHLAVVLADLRRRDLTGHAQVDMPSAELITAIERGIVQLDLFVARARALGEPSVQPVP